MRDNAPKSLARSIGMSLQVFDTVGNLADITKPSKGNDGAGAFRANPHRSPSYRQVMNTLALFALSAKSAGSSLSPKVPVS